MKYTQIMFACCFCGEDGADKGLALVGLHSGEFEQQWWCHLKCFLEGLQPTAKDAYHDPEGGD